jgi:hypothetical protein
LHPGTDLCLPPEESVQRCPEGVPTSIAGSCRYPIWRLP